MAIALTLAIGAALALAATVGARTEGHPALLDRDTQRQQEELAAIRAYRGAEARTRSETSPVI